MTEITKPEAMSRRKALGLLGLGAALGLVASSVSVSDAEAQTVGMERRQDRRGGRQDRRQGRRTGRQDRRQNRRQ
jgi:NAD(P)H-nitrite reductase large subunit